MFDAFLVPWNSYLFKRKEPESDVSEMGLKEQNGLGTLDGWKQKLKEPLNNMFFYSHGLPPKPSSNRSISSGSRRKRGLAVNDSRGPIESTLATASSSHDAVVPCSFVSSADGGESSRELSGLSSNFRDFNILAREDSENKLVCQGRVSKSEQEQLAESKNTLRRFPCAKDLGPGFIPDCFRNQICETVKSTVARVIRRVTGLTLVTVDKWFSLLSHFLELTPEEQLMFVILLRKYLRNAGSLRDCQDHLRPQKWERVLALCAYFSVWLSEEFAARTREDLVSLMGPRFRFQKEQIEFLIAVDWKVYIGYEEYCQTLGMFLITDDMQRNMRIWEWLGYSAMELTESLDVRKEVVLNNLTGLSTALNAGRKRQPATLSNEKGTEGTEERRFFRKMALDSFQSTNENNMDSSGQYVCVPNS